MTLLNYFKTFRYYFANRIRKISTVDSDLPRIYLRRHAKFRRAGLRGLRHTDSQITLQLCLRLVLSSYITVFMFLKIRSDCAFVV